MEVGGGPAGGDGAEGAVRGLVGRVVGSDARNYCNGCGVLKSMRLRWALPLAYASLMIVAAALHVSHHGGLAGDYVLTDAIYSDVVGDLADVGQVFFNRWRIPGESDPLFIHVVLYLGLPGFLLAKFVISFLGLLVDDLNVGFPFGLSYLSYLFSLGTVFALVQWHWIGRLAENLHERY